MILTINFVNIENQKCIIISHNHQTDTIEEKKIFKDAIIRMERFLQFDPKLFILQTGISSFLETKIAKLNTMYFNYGDMRFHSLLDFKGICPIIEQVKRLAKAWEEYGTYPCISDEIKKHLFQIDFSKEEKIKCRISCYDIKKSKFYIWAQRIKMRLKNIRMVGLRDYYSALAEDLKWSYLKGSIRYRHVVHILERRRVEDKYIFDLNKLLRIRNENEDMLDRTIELHNSLNYDKEIRYFLGKLVISSSKHRSTTHTKDDVVMYTLEDDGLVIAKDRTHMGRQHGLEFLFDIDMSENIYTQIPNTVRKELHEIKEDSDRKKMSDCLEARIYISLYNLQSIGFNDYVKVFRNGRNFVLFKQIDNSYYEISTMSYKYHKMFLTCQTLADKGVFIRRTKNTMNCKGGLFWKTIKGHENGLMDMYQTFFTKKDSAGMSNLFWVKNNKGKFVVLNPYWSYSKLLYVNRYHFDIQDGHKESNLVMDHSQNTSKQLKMI
jgi:hypothetical protein